MFQNCPEETRKAKIEETQSNQYSHEKHKGPELSSGGIFWEVVRGIFLSKLHHKLIPKSTIYECTLEGPIQ